MCESFHLESASVMLMISLYPTKKKCNDFFLIFVFNFLLIFVVASAIAAAAEAQRKLSLELTKRTKASIDRIAMSIAAAVDKLKQNKS